MTTYTYYCEDKTCRNEFPIPGRMGQEPPTKISCPRCLHNARRVIVAPTVIYRGGGFTGAGKRPRKETK